MKVLGGVIWLGDIPVCNFFLFFRFTSIRIFRFFNYRLSLFPCSHLRLVVLDHFSDVTETILQIPWIVDRLGNSWSFVLGLFNLFLFFFDGLLRGGNNAIFNWALTFLFNGHNSRLCLSRIRILVSWALPEAVYKRHKSP